MKRLTVEYNGFYVPEKLCTINRSGKVDDVEICPQHCKSEADCLVCAVQECFDRLAEYENLGVTPEQLIAIDRLYKEKCREVAELERLVDSLKAAGAERRSS